MLTGCDRATHLEDPDLAQRRLPDLFVLIRLFELLDRHNLSSLLVACLDDNAVRPERRHADGSGQLATRAAHDASRRGRGL
eukprot:scaffold35192_cov129-Isochrysis_galbana.AAC.2